MHAMRRAIISHVRQYILNDRSNSRRSRDLTDIYLLLLRFDGNGLKMALPAMAGAVRDCTVTNGDEYFYLNYLYCAKVIQVIES